ncbi:predicted protein [Postia placenta Mad-698-R]|uniref:Uncharacterized protein n=1 Tax=Postia placenta MAD-698-R-SB12 TaxID=670580 RepID=A0A1X6N6E8_9APHY|nr:hypothetical protein POSPLADRAFT_1138073 [Postia placenta MAD-698-R-SB12]EED78969.1 predicted protein [Postia placenta Mad-698-R]OSX64056.1 hypothetical protein POSPLADRAFT_1138073 [Postia placenta MAD-698-R-SB12]
MPVAPVDDKETQLYYEDSGAPPGSEPYITLVLVHGLIFHGGIFKPMFQYAPEHNMRLVAINLRDYPGSTPFSPSELDALRSDKADQATFISDRGMELARFLEWFILEHDLPPKALSHKSEAAGGLSILGWSLGNCPIMSMLASAHALPEATRKLLDMHLRSFIVYDPPLYTFGISDVYDDLYIPTRDKSIPPEGAAEAFSFWVSGYYRHTPTVLSSFNSLTREEILAGINNSPIDDSPKYQPTLKTMSPVEIAAVTDWAGAQRSHVAMLDVDSTVYQENAQRALLDKTVWPGLRVVLVWCTMSVGATVYGSWDLARRVRHAWPPGAREVDVKRLDGVNHFLRVFNIHTISTLQYLKSPNHIPDDRTARVLEKCEVPLQEQRRRSDKPSSYRVLEKTKIGVLLPQYS